MSQSVAIGSAVGRQPALNAITDQRAIIGLLNRIHHSQGGPMRPLPAPQRAGVASPELIAAILTFQNRHMEPRFRDSRVDPGGGTLAKLNAMANAAGAAGLETGVASEADRIEEETQEWLRKSLRFEPPGSDYKRLSGALQYLADKRNDTDERGRTINCGDKPLAYAEHYMLCRTFVVFFPINFRPGVATVFTLAVLAYDLVKLTNFLSAQLENLAGAGPGVVEFRRKLARVALQLGKCPMNDNMPDKNSVEWALRGVKKGLFTWDVSDTEF